MSSNRHVVPGLLVIAGLTWSVSASAAAPPSSLTLSRLETNAAPEPLGHRRSGAAADAGPWSAASAA